MSTELNPNIYKHLKFRTQHTASNTVTEAEQRKRLQTWKHWRRYGIKGDALEKRTKLTLPQVRRLAAALHINLEGLL